MYNVQSGREKKQYTELISAIKQLNSEKKALESSKEYRLGCMVSNQIAHLKKMELKKTLNSIQRYLKSIRSKKATTLPLQKNDNHSDYFSDKRIAVYTCITGKYDTVTDPLLFPDNCDFFLITDMPEANTSKWKTIDIRTLGNDIDLLSNAMKNRFVKMHPDIVFPDYDYSVYVDGSIRICTDLTEHVNRISQYGMAFYSHDLRNCVYDEIQACILLGKANKSELLEQIAYLDNAGMPRNYGLPACGIIARKHHDPLCKKVMQEWWNEYVNHAKRDQVNLPLVLHRNHIPVQDVTTLGSNMYLDDSLEFHKHL